MRMWCIALLFGITCYTLQWKMMRERVRKSVTAGEREKEKKLKKEKQEIELFFVREVANLEIATALGGITTFNNSPGLVGFCGVVEALLGIYQIWITC